MISDLISGSAKAQETVSDNSNSQNVPLLQASANADLGKAIADGDILISGDIALVSESGPSGTLADIPDSGNTGQITKYTVKSGDTIASVAKMFNISQNTIVWANNLPTKTLKEGQILIILPVSGTVHTIASKDTLKSIAKKYKADPIEIAQFNGIDPEDSLVVGDQLVVPDGEGIINASVSSTKKPTNSKKIYEPYLGGSGPDLGDYFIRPVFGGYISQGLHGWNAIDIGGINRTPIMAAASGEIIIARNSGYNGGYGKYVVISHPNGTQTVYGHMSRVDVYPGQNVVQGQTLGLSGNTGWSTGPHLHFEVRGAKNPLAN